MLGPMLPPLVQPTATPLDLDEVQAWAIPCAIGAMVGKGRARDAITEGVLRPADIAEAEIEPAALVWLPLWRVEGSVDAFSVGLTRTARTVLSGPDVGVLGGPGRRPPRSPKKRARVRQGVLPHGGYSHRDGVVPVLARAGFPIDPSAKVTLQLADLVPLADAELAPEATIAPDVPSAEAERHARRILARRGQPRGNTLFAKVDVEVRDARLCFYPLFVARYRYGGEAVEGGPRVFFTAVSGVTGKVVASEHPGALRSVGSKLRRLFGG